MLLLNQNRKIFILLLLLCSILEILMSSCKKKYKFSGSWSVGQTGILLTSFITEKKEFYDSCFSSKVKITDLKIILERKCFFADHLLQIDLHSRREISNLGEIDINNPERLLGSIYDLSKENPPSSFFVYDLVSNDSKKADSFSLIELSDKRIVLIWDPYFLVLRKNPNGD